MNRVSRAIITVALLLPGLAALAPQPAVAATPAGPITKLAVYMMENTSQAPAYAGMPFLSSLASQYGKATDYSDTNHPSEGNYVRLISGYNDGTPTGTCGLDDPTPGQCNQPSPTVFGQAVAKGLSAKLYQEGMDSNCSASGDYGHNPWLHFPGEAALCQQYDVPMGETSGGNLASDIAAGTLPNLSMIVPNDSNNAHSGPLSVADNYLQGWMNAIFAGPDWHSGHLAVVITFDEGETTEQVAYVVVSPAVASGTVFTGTANHDSTARLYSEVIGAAPLHGAATATDLAGPFNFSSGAVSPPPTTTTTVPAGPPTATTVAAPTTTAPAPTTTVATPTTTAPPTPAPGASSAGTLHYTSNEGEFTTPASVGFNVHDTGTDQATIDSLPNGGKALVWLGEKCPSGLSPAFTGAVKSLGHDPRVFGYYLSDEPDPGACPQGPVNVAAESDFIHANAPGQRSFVVVDDTPGAWAAYAPAHSHLDLVGLDPYPCRTDTSGCNLSMIDSAVSSAEAAGIPQSIIAPVFQAFGGSPAWVMPTPQQLQAILAEWAKLVPSPVLDYAYSWGCQGGSLSDCLANHPEAQAVLQAHNTATGSSAPATTVPAPTTTVPAPTTTVPGPTTTAPTTAPATTAPATTAPGATSTTTPTTASPRPSTPPTSADIPPPAEPPNTTTTVPGSKKGSHKHHEKHRPSKRRHGRTAHTEDAMWLEPSKSKAWFQGDWYEALKAGSRGGSD